MVFGDDDLKQLKGTIARHEVCLGDSGKLLALLARLEAGEKLIQMMAPHFDVDEARLYGDWLKACGRKE